MTTSTKPPRDYDLLYKLVLIGDTGVGKSCILLRFADDAFTESYITTIGVDFRFRVMTIDDKAIKLQIWDTAGQERFRTITSAYYRGADGIVLCYDCTERSSFNNIDEWLAEVNRYASDNTCKILVANKCDLESDKQVSTEEGRKKAEELGIDFIETSAKDATNVEDAFVMIARQLLKRKPPATATSFPRQRTTPGMRLQPEARSPSSSNIFSSCCSAN